MIIVNTQLKVFFENLGPDWIRLELSYFLKNLNCCWSKKWHKYKNWRTFFYCQNSKSGL